jgi:hypothetical protein
MAMTARADEQVGLQRTFAARQALRSGAQGARPEAMAPAVAPKRSRRRRDIVMLVLQSL